MRGKVVKRINKLARAFGKPVEYDEIVTFKPMKIERFNAKGALEEITQQVPRITVIHKQGSYGWLRKALKKRHKELHEEGML
jgi:hypothetical protein